MAIEGQKKEFSQTRFVGLFEGRVIAINPSAEEYEKITGFPPREDSKALEYLGESKDGNVYLRLDIWLEDTVERDTGGEGKIKPKFKVSFYIEDRERVSKDGLRTQYINNVGKISWADDENKLPVWFKAKDYRVAKVGEEELYEFLKTWLGGLNLNADKTTLSLDWKRLMRGNVKELREQMGGEFEKNVVALATIHTEERDGDILAYQRVYNAAFSPANTIKFFKLLDYEDEKVIERIKEKPVLNRKAYEKFALKVTNSEYGCKDFYKLRELKLYNPEENIVASTEVINEGDATY